MNLYSFPKTNQHTWKSVQWLEDDEHLGCTDPRSGDGPKCIKNSESVRRSSKNGVWHLWFWNIVSITLCYAMFVCYHRLLCIIFIILRHHSSLFIMIIHWLVSTYLHPFTAINLSIRHSSLYVIISHYEWIWFGFAMKHFVPSSKWLLAPGLPRYPCWPTWCRLCTNHLGSTLRRRFRNLNHSNIATLL